MRIKYLLAGAAALCGAAMFSTPSAASEPITCVSGEGIFSPAATDCVGYYSGNVLDNKSADVTTQTNALAALGVTFTDFNNYPKIGLNGSSTDINFGTPLSGIVIIGVHWGNVPDSTFNPSNTGTVGNVSGFFEFNLGSTPVSSIALTNSQGISGAVLYESGTPFLPEPATWAMMILGFGAAGFALRRYRRETTLISQLA
jgi:hypothetical protein